MSRVMGSAKGALALCFLPSHHSSCSAFPNKRDDWGRVSDIMGGRGRLREVLLHFGIPVLRATVLFKGPLKYLVAKLHSCHPSAISLPVSQKFFRALFSSPNQVAGTSFFASLQQTQEKLFFYIFID